jgi:hypothetical protein
MVFYLFIVCNSKLYSQFYALETNNLRLINYGKSTSYLAKHIAQSFELSLMLQQNIFNYRPHKKITVLVHDIWDYGNAGALVIPKNQIILGIAPGSHVFETNPAGERIKSTIGHELVHIFSSDKPTATDNFFRSVFLGKVSTTPDDPISIFYSYLTNPRWYSPRWYHEGIAVFMETWMAGGLGRALGAYDEMVFRTLVRDSSYIYDVIGLESEGTTIDFQVGVNSYLYGTRFISYLVHQYGIENLFKWYNRTNDSDSYFVSQFEKVYKVNLDTEWSRWIEWENVWQQKNLNLIRRYKTTKYTRISNYSLGAVSRAFYNKKKKEIYVAIKYPGQVAHIASIDIRNGNIYKICDVLGAAGYSVSAMAYDQSSETIFYTTGNNQWRDLNAVNIKTGKIIQLINDARTGDFAFNRIDKSLWGIRHYNGISTLVRIPYPYKEWNKIYSYPFGEDIYDLDISPNGKHLIAAFCEISGRQRLIKMDVNNLLQGDTSFVILFDFENSNPASFVFSDDGRYLYGSSYYSGVSNIYRFDFENKDMDIISNCETGFFRPVPISNDSLVVFNYTGSGFVPVMIPNQTVNNVGAIKYLGNEIAEKYSTVKTWTLGLAASINIDSLTTSSGKYNQISNIKLISAYPIIQGYKNFAAYGFRFNFLDQILLSGLELSASYSPNEYLPIDERVHIKFNFHHWGWKLRANYNGAYFYDLFGPTKTSRKGYSLGFQYNKTLLYDEPKTLNLIIDTNWYGGLEKLPDFQNVNATFEKLLSTKANLSYQFVRKSLGAVDDEKGIKWQFITHNNYVNQKNYLRIFSNLDYGISLPLNHSSIWIRSSFGHSFGEKENPFANFFFGGFGNNWIDSKSEKRYREYYSFPGVDLNYTGGKNYMKFMLEWNLPPLRFRRLGFLSLYCNWARLAFFTSVLQVNIDSKNGYDPDVQYGAQKTLANIGGQLDYKLVVFSNRNLTFSFGYAAAFERKQNLNNEFMISLKIF